MSRVTLLTTDGQARRIVSQLKYPLRSSSSLAINPLPAANRHLLQSYTNEILRFTNYIGSKKTQEREGTAC
jgi:hypothetical protein